MGHLIGLFKRTFLQIFGGYILTQRAIFLFPGEIKSSAFLRRADCYKPTKAFQITRSSPNIIRWRCSLMAGFWLDISMGSRGACWGAIIKTEALIPVFPVLCDGFFLFGIGPSRHLQ